MTFAGPAAKELAFATQEGILSWESRFVHTSLKILAYSASGSAARFKRAPIRNRAPARATKLPSCDASSSCLRPAVSPSPISVQNSSARTARVVLRRAVRFSGMGAIPPPYLGGAEVFSFRSGPWSSGKLAVFRT